MAMALPVSIQSNMLGKSGSLYMQNNIYKNVERFFGTKGRFHIVQDTIEASQIDAIASV